MFKLVAGVRYIYTHPRLLHLMVLAVPHCAFRWPLSPCSLSSLGQSLVWIQRRAYISDE